MPHPLLPMFWDWRDPLRRCLKGEEDDRREPVKEPCG